MANRTVTEATNIHGTNPQFLIEKIIRTRIYDSLYWKESCFALTAETIIDKAVALQSIGGQYGNQKPTEFLCLALKMLQLQPEKEILRLYIQNEDYKYLRALGAFYLRLTGTAVEIYRYLEPLLLDFRKLRRRNISGDFGLTYMDEFVDDLLRSDRVCDTILPRITKRHILEETGELEPRVSPLEEDLEDEDEEGKSSEATAMTTGGGGHGTHQVVDRQLETVNPRPRARAATPVRVHRREAATAGRGRDRHRGPATVASRPTVLIAVLLLDAIATTSATTGGAAPVLAVKTSPTSVTTLIADLRATVAAVVGITTTIVIMSETSTAAGATTDTEAVATVLALVPQTGILTGASGGAADPAPAVEAAAVTAVIIVQMTNPMAQHPTNASAAAVTVRDLTMSPTYPPPLGIRARQKKSSDKKKFSSSRGDDGGSGAGGGGGGGGAQESMSVEETNKMRAALGLKPLKM
ncbi:hypothetical protein HDU88_006119 [Geranomyces variabilis]|nr:hypothetical protein HDU88_006119 [Geranomyces variabilis]